MEENRQGSVEEKKNLKYADMNKPTSDRLDANIAEITDLYNRKKKKRKNKKNAAARRRSKIPPAVDVAVAVLVVIAIAALIFGAYYLLRHYVISGYTDAKMEYTVVLKNSNYDAESAQSLDGVELYYNNSGSSVYFGRVKSVSVVDAGDGSTQTTMCIEVTAQYKKGEGFSVGGKRLAVGSEYPLFSGDARYSVTVVEMALVSTKEAKK